MQLGTILENHICARCQKRLTLPVVYHDAYYHACC
jgi:hypothetical protein